MAERYPTADGQFHILKQIGEGGYGSVYLVQHLTWGEVVLKKLRDQNDIGADDLNILRHEAEILKTLRHPNIVTLYDGQFDMEFCGLFLEHAKYGSVDSFLKKFSVSVEWKMQIIYDVASAMTYLHDKQPPIIHGDLKALNVLIGNEFHAKICDFGLARMHTISKSITTNSNKGTLEYIAPEYISDPRKRKTEQFDVYCYAILVWEIFSQKRAYHDFSDRLLIPVSVVNGERPLLEDIVDEINETLVTMIQDCWHQNVEARPTFKHIRKSIHDENARIQNKIKESLIIMEQQKNQHMKTLLTARSQESKPQYPDSGESMDCSTELKSQQNLDHVYKKNSYEKFKKEPERNMTPMPEKNESHLARNTREYRPISSVLQKRNALSIPCPCKEEADISEQGFKWWTCWNCGEIIDQGFDKFYYCKCGQAHCTQFEFKCYDPSHGNDFREFHPYFLRTMLLHQKPKPEFNILILGPTGVGKSTWINSIVNYMTFSTLREANQQNKPLSLIGGSFQITDSNYTSRKIIINNDSNEADNTVGQSSTQFAKAYVFEERYRLLRVIDTPGIGDTRGVDQDSLNFENMLKFLTQLNELHAICILLKSNDTRPTVFFKYCIQDLLKHLHKDALENIMFCFTNARSTFYRPGESLATLRQLLHEQQINLTLNERNMYCMDNEAFKLLCALKQKTRFSDAEIKLFERSWDVSVAETNRLLDNISKLKPHNLQDTQSLNKTRQSFLILIHPIGDISQNIQSNIALVSDKKVELCSKRKTITELKTKLYIPRKHFFPHPLENPRTVCTASKCVEYHKIPFTNGTMIDYVTHCHEKCFCVKSVFVEQGPNPELKHCTAMGGTLNCKHCGCTWDKHMRIIYDNRIEYYMELDQGVQVLIVSIAAAEKVIEATISNLSKRIEDLEKEKYEILKTSVKLAHFLKKFAMVSYNDSMSQYLEKLIELEQQKSAAGGDKKILAGLEDMLRKYKEEKFLFENIHPGQDSEDVIDLEKMDALIKNLYSLPLAGSELKRFFEVAAAARMQIMAYSECRYRVKATRFREIFNFFRNSIASNAMS